LMFVNVSPAQAVAEPPKDAKFYSDKNSRAANPEPDDLTEVPKIDGKQTEVVKTEDISRQKFTPLQPSPPPPQPPQEAQPEVKPKPAYTPGALTLAKPSPTPRKDEGEANEAKEAKPARPRTIKEALAQLQNSQLPGQKLKQDGGVRRRHEMASLDTKATPFGAYDAALVEAISQRWFTLLDQRDYASDSRGKVVLQFRLHHDGRVSEMNVAENTAGEVLGLICQKAVLDPAPFAAWPSDMRRTLGDTRNIQFTFYYN
jgi:outer membrane biosynthesis protein TonB